MIVKSLTLLVLLSQLLPIKSAVLIADFRMSRMIEMTARQPLCKLYTDR